MKIRDREKMYQREYYLKNKDRLLPRKRKATAKAYKKMVNGGGEKLAKYRKYMKNYMKKYYKDNRQRLIRQAKMNNMKRKIKSGNKVKK